MAILQDLSPNRFVPVADVGNSPISETPTILTSSDLRRLRLAKGWFQRQEAEIVLPAKKPSLPATEYVGPRFIAPVKPHLRRSKRFSNR